MELKDIKTVNEVAVEHNISRQTLLSRIVARSLVEDIDFKKLGRRMPILLSPQGIDKLLSN